MEDGSMKRKVRLTHDEVSSSASLIYSSCFEGAVKYGKSGS